MRILALDMSMTSAGFACWAPGDAKPMSGAWKLGSEYTTPGGVFSKLHQNISHVAAMGPIDAIFYEEPLHLKINVKKSNARSHLLAVGLAAHAESWAFAMGCRYARAVDMAHWRAHFLKGMTRPKNADGSKIEDALKVMAVDRARSLGFKPRTHDEAEALGILSFAFDSLGIAAQWSELRIPGTGVFARAVHA